jgi:outer membrane receptor protein involved in Fe transport
MSESRRDFWSAMVGEHKNEEERVSKYLTLTLLLLFMVTEVAISQETQSRGAGTIIGTVYDATHQAPLEYANVILFTAKDSLQLTGTITNNKGKFRMDGIRPGVYYAEFQFMGYHPKRTDEITINASELKVDIGTIRLEQTVLSMEGVEVEGERPAISYQIDKKVINVSQHYTAISGTAIDVLENVPSVTVDIEGNVSLRGSGNFKVFIDGRPSVLEPSEALQQIPASTIENIEIITNPSAKYDPEGTSGIINIIQKNNPQRGRSGIANLDAGLNDKYGGDFLVEQKNSTYSATFGVDYNKRSFSGDDLVKNQTSREELTSFIHSNGDSRRGRISLGLRGVFDLNFSEEDMLSFGARYGDRSSKRNSGLDYDEWSDPGGGHSLYTSTTDRERSGPFYALNTSYRHRFAQQGQEFSGDMFYSYRDSDEKTTNELLSDVGVITSGQRSTESGPGRRFRLKLDYAHPFENENKFEVGYQSELNQSDDNTGLYGFSAEQGVYVLLPQYSNSTRYDRKIHAVYAIYSEELNRFGYQGGLRGEYTDRSVEFAGVAKPFTIQRWDYFPTFHTSYKFPAGQQVMASYTRRIERPRGWELEPFETWMDAYNVRIGNPSLTPEYIDSYEIGVQTHLGNSLLSAEAYYRKTNNKTERVRSVYDDNITLRSIENIGTDFALGTELLLNLDVAKSWNINLLGNLYNYRVEGKLYGESFSRESFNWRTRMSNTIKIGSSTQIQLDGNYQSSTVSSQGRREGFFTTNAAVKYEFLKRQLSATLQVRDIFSTSKREYTSEGTGFYNYIYSTRESPVVMLNIRYNFNNYKPDRQRDGNRESIEDNDEF